MSGAPPTPPHGGGGPHLSSPPPPGTMTFLKATLRAAAPGAGASAAAAAQSPRTPRAGVVAASVPLGLPAAASGALVAPLIPVAGMPLLIPPPGMWSPALSGRAGPPLAPLTPATRNGSAAVRPLSTPLPPALVTPVRAGSNSNGALIAAAAGAGAGTSTPALSLNAHSNTPPRGDLSSPAHGAAVQPLVFSSSPPHPGAGGHSSPTAGSSSASASAAAAAGGISTPTSSSSGVTAAAAAGGGATHATPPAAALSSGRKRKSRSNAAAKAKAKLLAAAAHSAVKDEPGFCDVCYASDSDPTNPVVYCVACHVGVHRTCYGNPLLNSALPTANWKCERCLSGAHAQGCMLCPITTGAMKRTTDWRWCHLRCALWVPEVFFRQGEAREPIDCSQIKAHRWNQQCVHCASADGVCLQCAVKGCARTFHVTCGMAHGIALHCQAAPLPGKSAAAAAAAGATVDVFIARCAKHANTAADVAAVAAVDSSVAAAAPATKAHPPLAAAAATAPAADVASK